MGGPYDKSPTIWFLYQGPLFFFETLPIGSSMSGQMIASSNEVTLVIYRSDCTQKGFGSGVRIVAKCREPCLCAKIFEGSPYR